MDHLPAKSFPALVKAAMAAALVTTAHAAPPKLEALFPAGGQRGSSFGMKGTGPLDADVRLWVDSPDLFFSPTGNKREWQVTISPNAPPGPHLVYATSSEGASEPRWFSVGLLPDMTEAEPNDEVGKGQSIAKLPVCINARLDKAGDVDGYTVTLAAGQTLVATVEAYALGSAVDAVAHVIDPQGQRVFTASDSRNLDPAFAFTAASAGNYTVQIAGFAHPPVADVRFTGGDAVVYRLHLSTGPTVTQVFPPVIAASGKTEMELRGYNLDPKKTKFSVDAPRAGPDESVTLVMPPDAILPLQALIASKPANLEREPNNSRDQATPCQPGFSAGQISGRDDVDRFAITLKKGDRLQAQVWSKRLGLPLDALLQVEAPDGKVIASTDDQSEEQPDPIATWTATADGPYQMVVQDLFHKGGSDRTYALQIGPELPRFDTKIADGKPLMLEPGKTTSIKVTVKLRGGFKEPLVVRAANLPPGVHAADAVVPEKGGDVELKLQAASNAPAGGQAVAVSVWTQSDPSRMQPATIDLRGENRRGTSLLDTTRHIWVQVKPAK